VAAYGSDRIPEWLDPFRFVDSVPICLDSADLVARYHNSANRVLLKFRSTPGFTGRAQDGRAAAPEFQKLFDHRGIVSTSVTGALAHLQMGRAQKMAGDEAAAHKSYEEFLTLWKQPDPDIPIYREAKSDTPNSASARR
jgi:hypothetical protein